MPSTTSWSQSRHRGHLPSDRCRSVPSSPYCEGVCTSSRKAAGCYLLFLLPGTIFLPPECARVQASETASQWSRVSTQSFRSHSFSAFQLYTPRPCCAFRTPLVPGTTPQRGGNHHTAGSAARTSAKSKRERRRRRRRRSREAEL